MFRLPDELLAEIFFEYSLDYADAPMLLSSVCRPFRDILLHSPDVWTQLNISLSTWNARAMAKKVAIWLKRSGACLIQLDISLSLNQHSTDVGSSLEPVITLLQQNRSRFISLEVHSPTGALSHRFLEALYPCSSDLDVLCHAQNSLRLESLKIDIAREHSTSTHTFLPSLTSMYHLKSLELVNHFIPLPATTEAHFLHLRSISIIRPLRASPLPATQLLQLLQAAPMLSDIHIETRVMAPRMGQRLPPPVETVLPQVRRLTLRANNMSLLLGPMVLPALEDLHLHDLNGKGERSAQKLSGAVRRVLASVDAPFCRLRELELSGVSLRMDSEGEQATDWAWCIQRMWKVERLRLIDTDGNALFSHLTHTEEGGEACGGSLFPQLKVMELERSTVSEPVVKAWQKSRPTVFIHDLTPTWSTEPHSAPIVF